MNKNYVLGAIAFIVLVLLALSGGQNSLPAQVPEIRTTPVLEAELPSEIFAPGVALTESAQFEAVENWSGSKRGERLAPATPEQIASLPGPAPRPEPGDARIEFAVAGPEAIDLLDGLIAPRVDAMLVFSQPDGAATPRVSAVASEPANAAEAIGASFRSLARRLEEGSSGALLSFN